ncbi:MAG: hypothetical protein LBU11_06260 [Zoogloeaceae bacterium]|jgi:hypothetical protein|nr:hypothetical protein [Zoogloeaceae bacterium]
MSHNDQVFEAILSLRDKGQMATRDAVITAARMRPTLVDGCLRRLREDGRIVSPVRGVFVPVAQHREAQPVSLTVLPDGMAKLEIGDALIELTPRERQLLGDVIAPSSLQYSAISLAEEIREQQSALRLREKEKIRLESQKKDAASRPARILKRYRELQGTRNFVKVIAGEEGITRRHVIRIIRSMSPPQR